MEKIQKELKKQLDLIKEKTGIDGKIITGVLLVAIILTAIKIFSALITSLVGIVVPTYMSLKAIKSENLEDDTALLTYWVVFGLFTLIDLVADKILQIFPFYYILKLVFLIWCFMPNFKGAELIYRKFIEPFFNKYEGAIDKEIEKISKRGKEIKKNATSTLNENKEKILEAGEKVISQVKKKIN